MTEGRTISQVVAERPSSKQRDGVLLPGVRQATMAVVRGPKTPRIEAICSVAGGVEGGFAAPDSDDGADGPVGGDDGAAVEWVEGDGVDFLAGAGRFDPRRGESGLLWGLLRCWLLLLLGRRRVLPG